MIVKCHEVRLFHYLETNFDSYNIEVPASAASEWCLHLSLLLLSSVECLQIGPSQGGHENSQEGNIVQIYRYKLGDTGFKDTFTYDNNTMRLTLGRDEIESWMWHSIQHIYTNYVRNTSGYSDHIDVEYNMDGGSGKTIDITISIV